MFEPNDPRPRGKDLRGSGTLEEDADKVILLNISPEYDPDSESPYKDKDMSAENEILIDVYVAKNRDGPRGKFHLPFNRKLMLFTNAPIDPFK
jgi:replicative DNA helicase